MDISALHKITYGLYVVGSRKGEDLNAQIANTVIQVCSEPPIIAVCINKANLSHEYIHESRSFSVSILAQDTPLSFIGNLGFKCGRDENKLKEVNYKIGETGSPVVMDHTLAILEAIVTSEASTPTHTIFIGGVVNAGVLREGDPMTYAYYHQVKRGTTPKTAPSYVAKHKQEESGLDKYECTICGYVYDPAEGDPEGGISPGTRFEDIPDDWVCPTCGASKDQFEKVQG